MPAVQIDDFALFRQPEFAGLGEPNEHALEAQAKRGKLFYQKTGKGNIGCYGYGAGVAMSTMDALILEGGEVSYPRLMVIYSNTDFTAADQLPGWWRRRDRSQRPRRNRAASGRSGSQSHLRQLFRWPD